MMIPDWAKELNCSITVCDKDGVIIYQNDPAVRQYEKQVYTNSSSRAPGRKTAR